MSRFRPESYAEAAALRAEKPRKPRKQIARGKGLRARSDATGLKQTWLGCARARPKTTPDPELTAWGRKVKKQDGNRCQFPDCGFCGQSTQREMVMDPHHKALRSARPDLRLVPSNGVTVCRPRHNWIHSPEGHDEAVRLGFLNPRTRELAAKEGTLGIR